MITRLRTPWSVLVIVALALAMLPLLLVAEENGEAPRAAPSAGTAKFSLDRWRAAREEFQDALRGTSPAEKVEKLEAFQAKYPDYEYASSMKLLMAEARVESGHYDPEDVTQTLLEGLPMGQGWGGCDNVVYWAKSYAVNDKLPVENAWRVLEAAKAWGTGQAAKKQAETQPPWSEYSRRRCEYNATLAEGEILLAEGNAAGALPLLRHAESSAFLAGNDLLLMDEKGATRGLLPTGDSADLDLALAKAYARTGNAREAREHLTRLNLYGWDAERKKDVQAISRKAGWNQPAGREWTTEPVQATPFEFKDLAGKKVKYSDYRGKVILLNFWETT
jgi:hypothetical protein